MSEEDHKKEIDKLTKNVKLWKDSAAAKGKDIKVLKDQIAQLKEGGGTAPQEGGQVDNEQLARIEGERDRAYSEKVELKTKMQQEIDDRQATIDEQA